MIELLKPYSAYKETNIDAFPVVPDHWALQSVGRIGSLFKGNGRSKEDSVNAGVPCVRYGDLYTTYEYFIRATKGFVTRERAIHYTRLNYGDLLFAGSGETFEDIGRSAVNLLATDAVCGGDVVVCRPRIEVVPEFLGYAADSTVAKYQKSRMGRGFTVVHIYSSDLKDLQLPFPPFEEQRTIARFLGYMDRRIRRYIAAKKELIALLKEQKQLIIHRAVIRGLDANVALKASGADWLGDVPERWTITSLRFRYDQCLGKMVDAKNANGKHPTPYLRNVDVHWDSINTENLPLIDIRPDERERFTLKSGDLVACEGRHLGRAAFWNGQLPVCGFQKALHRLRAIDATRDCPRFLFYCLYVANFKDAFGASSADRSIPHLTGEMLRAHRFPFPPFREQMAIADELDEEVSTIRNATLATQAEIGRALEYRARLIADVVTGKFDVREAAAGLPAEVDEPSDPEKTIEDDGQPVDAASEEEEALA